MVKHVYTSVDIGSDAIKVIVCELYKGKLNLLAATSVKSKGIKKGLITDLEQATASLKKAIEEIEAMLGIKIKKVISSVPAYFAEFNLVKANVTIESADGMVTGNDIIKSLQEPIKDNLGSGKEVVTMLPIDFSVDEQERVRDPKGLFGKELEARAIMVTTPKKNIYSVISLLDMAGLEVVDISLNPIGDIYAFKTKEMDKEVGAVVDIGEETTTVSLYNRGILVKCSVIAAGAKAIDHDLACMYKISLSNARAIKEKFALAHKKHASANETFEVTNEVGDKLTLNQLEVSEVVMFRLEEILNMASNEIKSLTDHKMDYTIVTGGITNMSHFDVALEEIMPGATLGNVRLVGIRNNKYSVCIGNVVYFINKLKLKGKDYSMISATDSEEISETKKRIINNVSEDSTLGKLFNYFFSEQ